MTDEAVGRYLVVYDYGMGGLWAVVLARSADEILERYPELDIVKMRPGWMSESKLAALKADPLTLDGEPQGLFKAVISDRGRD